MMKDYNIDTRTENRPWLLPIYKKIYSLYQGIRHKDTLFLVGFTIFLLTTSDLFSAPEFSKFNGRFNDTLQINNKLN